MQKSNLVTVEFFGKTSIYLKNISSFSIHNVGESDILFRGRRIAPQDTFLMEGDGTYSDIDFYFDFEGTGKNHLIMDYRAIVQC